jgi:hypothetical protein
MLVVGLVGVANATSYGPPQKHDVRSPDGLFVLHVDPHAQRITVARTDAPQAPLWSLERKIGFETYFLAPGGKRVAAVTWRFVQVDKLGEPAVEILDGGGRVTYWSVEDLIAQPPRIRGVGPIGPFWRRWLVSAHQDGEQLIVETAGLHRYRFEIANAEMIASELRPAGLALIAGGYGMLALAVLLVWWTRRAARGVETPIEKRRFAWSVVPAIALFVWLWLDLAGVPLLPAEHVGMLRIVAAVVAVVATPIALLAIARLPPGTRLGRALLAVASPIVVARLVVLW